MPDIALVNPAITSAPKDYKIPGSSELLLKAVTANVDGTSAGGTFLPALQLLDPAGNVMWTAVARSLPVAAGGTANVSWFPGGGVDEAGAGSDTDVGTIGKITSTAGTLTILNPTGPTTNADLATTSVSAGSYGDSGHVGTFTVDADGRLTAASSVSITGGGVVAGADGWVTDTNTPVFATASSFTAGASDLTAVYSPGTRIKFTQTTVKYFVVTSSSFGGGTTTVNVTAGTDYTVANAAITSPFYSYVLNPQGFPTWFNYNANATGFSATTSNVGRFTMQGRMCIVQIQVTGTSNAATFTCDLPVAPKTTGGYSVLVTNAGATTAGRMVPTAGATSGAAVFGASAGSGGGFTTSGTKGTTGVAGATNTPLQYEV